MDETIDISATSVEETGITEEELNNLTNKIAYCYTEDDELLTMIPKDILEKLEWLDNRDILFMVDYDCKTVTLKIDDF